MPTTGPTPCHPDRRRLRAVAEGSKNCAVNLRNIQTRILTARYSTRFRSFDSAIASLRMTFLGVRGALCTAWGCVD